MKNLKSYNFVCKIKSKETNFSMFFKKFIGSEIVALNVFKTVYPGIPEWLKIKKKRTGLD